MQLKSRLLNVFALAGDPFSGNPLCVFEDGRGLDTATMQALARQFSLSETTFIMPADRADAFVRIFTPDYEMPFAGHPTLGTAAVVHSLSQDARQDASAMVLAMQAGLIPVSRQGVLWTLRANAPTTRVNDRDPAELAAALGLQPGDIIDQPQGPRPLWVNTGVEQLLVPLASLDAVRRVQSRLTVLAKFWRASFLRAVLCCWKTRRRDPPARIWAAGIRAPVPPGRSGSSSRRASSARGRRDCTWK